MVLGRFDSLRQLGLTSTMLAVDFFRRCLAPLQAHPYPAWFYTGDDDASRLGCGAEFSPDATTVAQWLELAMEEKDPGWPSSLRGFSHCARMRTGRWCSAFIQ